MMSYFPLSSTNLNPVTITIILHKRTVYELTNYEGIMINVEGNW